LGDLRNGGSHGNAPGNPNRNDAKPQSDCHESWVDQARKEVSQRSELLILQGMDLQYLLAGLLNHSKSKAAPRQCLPRNSAAKATKSGSMPAPPRVAGLEGTESSWH